MLHLSISPSLRLATSPSLPLHPAVSPNFQWTTYIGGTLFIHLSSDSSTFPLPLGGMSPLRSLACSAEGVSHSHLCFSFFPLTYSVSSIVYAVLPYLRPGVSGPISQSISLFHSSLKPPLPAAIALSHRLESCAAGKASFSIASCCV